MWLSEREWGAPECVDKGAGSGVVDADSVGSGIGFDAVIGAESEIETQENFVEAHVAVDAGHTRVFLVIIFIEMRLEVDDLVVFGHSECRKPS